MVWAELKAAASLEGFLGIEEEVDNWSTGHILHISLLIRLIPWCTEDPKKDLILFQPQIENSGRPHK